MNDPIRQRRDRNATKQRILDRITGPTTKPPAQFEPDEARTKFQTPVRFTLHDFERRQRERDRALIQRLIQQITRDKSKGTIHLEAK